MGNSGAWAAPLPSEKRRSLPDIRRLDPDDDAAAAAILLIRAMGVRVSDLRIRRLVRQHANPTSMLAILETLTRLGLGAKAVEVDADHLDRIPLPAVAHLQSEEGPTFAVLHEVSADSALLTDPIRGVRRLGRIEYLARSTGKYVIASAGAEFRGLSPARYVFEQALGAGWGFVRRRWTLIAVAALGMAAGVAAVGNPAHAATLGLATAGLIVSGILAEFALNGPRGLAGRLCALSPRFGCADLLASPHASLFGLVPYSFLGVGYSLGVWASAVSGAWAAVQVLLAPSIPVAVAMIWILARRAKTWCPWCLLWHGLNASALLAAWSGPADPSRAAWVADMATAAAAFAVPVAFYLVRSYRGTLRQASDRWARLTGDPNVLWAVYQSGAPAGVAGETEPLRLGQADAPVELTLFSHPLCPHCPSVHAEVSSMVEGSDPVRVIHRLVTPNPPVELPDFLDARRSLRPPEWNALLYAIGAARGPAAFADALKRVFSRQGEFRFLSPREAMARLGVSADEVRRGMEKGYGLLRSDAEIARRARVAFTPTLFLNGRRMPDWASPAQRKFLIDLVRRSALPRGANS